MGWYQTVHGPLTCPVCGRESADAEADLVVPFPPNDLPLYLAVGDALGLREVATYDRSLVALRERADRGQGRAISMWTCFHCLADRWALIGLGEVEGAARVTSFEAAPAAPETLETADWIHGSIVADLVRGTTHAEDMPLGGRLSEAQRRVLADLVAARGTDGGKAG